MLLKSLGTTDLGYQLGNNLILNIVFMFRNNLVPQNLQYKLLTISSNSSKLYRLVNLVFGNQITRNCLNLQIFNSLSTYVLVKAL